MTSTLTGGGHTYRAVLLAALLFGCSSSEQTTDTVTIPADTTTTYLYSQYGGVVHNPDCDSVEVLSILLERAGSELRAETARYNLAIQALTEGYVVDADASRRAIDSLRQRMDYYRLALRAEIARKPEVLPLPDELQGRMNRLRADVAERDAKIGQLEAEAWSWLELVGLCVVSAVAGFVILRLAEFAVRSGILKLPIG